MKKSFEKFDYVELVAINTDGTILAGHQRCQVLTHLGHGDEEIEVRVPSRELSAKECEEYLIRSNQNTGTWDFDILANDFESCDLLSYGFEEKFLLEGIDIPTFGDEEPESRAEEKQKALKECPECGHKF